MEQWKSLSEVVGEALVLLGESTEDRFVMAETAARMHWSDMNFDTTDIYDEAMFEVDENGFFFFLPKGYVKYACIGLCVDGRIVPLGLDDKLCRIPSSDTCGNPVPGHINSNTTTDNSCGWWYDYETYKKFTDGKRGFFTVDQKAGRVYVSSDVATYGEVYMKWKTTGEVPGQEVKIHPWCVTLLNYKIRCEVAPHVSRLTAGYIGDLNQKAVKAELETRRRFMSMTVDEWRDTFRRNYRKTIKYE